MKVWQQLSIFVISVISMAEEAKHFHDILLRGVSRENMVTILKKQNDLRFQKKRRVSLSEAVNTIIREYREYIGQQ